MATNGGNEDKLKDKVKEQLKKKATSKSGDKTGDGGRLNEADFESAGPRPALRSTHSDTFVGRRGRAMVVSTFCRELAILLESGYPLMRGLTLLANKTSNRDFAYEIEKVARQVEKGSTLATAISGSEAYFSPMLVSMVEAGEASGELVTVLTNIADDLDANDELTDKIKEAISYPILTALVALMVFLVVLIFVVPTFNEVYTKSNMDLPMITSILVGLSVFITSYWWLWIPALVGGLWYVWKRAGQDIHAFDNLLLNMPLIGEIVVLGNMARFCTALKVMLANGVPILQSLKLAKGTIGNRRLKDVIQRMADNVEAGKSLGQPLADAGYFPPIMVDMLFVGEESGKLPFVLGQIVLALRVQLDRIISRLSLILGPIMTLIVGFMVLFITLSLFIPYFGFLTGIAEVPVQR